MSEHTSEITVADAAANDDTQGDVVSGNEVVTAPGYNEMVGTLTGNEEFAIEKAFGRPLGNLFDEVSMSMAYRALAFVTYLREGVKETEARTRARSLTVKQASELYSDDFALIENPRTEPGKDTPAP